MVKVTFPSALTDGLAISLFTIPESDDFMQESRINTGVKSDLELNAYHISLAILVTRRIPHFVCHIRARLSL